MVLLSNDPEIAKTLHLETPSIQVDPLTKELFFLFLSIFNLLQL
jgi:hypothetical protein